MSEKKRRKSNIIKSGDRPYFANSLWVTDGYLETLADELIEWAHKETSNKLSEFVVSHKRIAPSRWHGWSEKNANLKEAIMIAKIILGNRRELKGLQGDWQPGIVLKTLGMYDPEFRAWEIESRQNRGEESGTVNVYLEKFPNSPLVPDKKEQE